MKVIGAIWNFSLTNEKECMEIACPAYARIFMYYIDSLRKNFRVFRAIFPQKTVDSRPHLCYAYQTR